MNRNENKNTEFEKLLKEKMDGLASSVDCFDKISRKAFPEASASFDGEGYTVSELENITGKTKRFRFMPVMAAAAAFVLCLFFLPKSSGFMNFLYSNIGKSDKNVFNEIINELNDERHKYSYVSFDCTLDEYIENDVIITPFIECPFEKNEKKDLNVRIFVKMSGNVPTNQVYAVVYEGRYLDGNFIAAADSAAKFSEEEFAALPEIYSLPIISDTVCYNNGIIGASGSSLTDKDGNAITLAGFDYECYYKNGSSIALFNSDICYYALNDSDEDSVKYYDIRSYFRTDSGDFAGFDCFTASEIYDPEKMWDNVVYFSGDSARAVTDESDFVRADIFGDEGDPAVSARIFLPDNTNTEEVKSREYISISSENSLIGKIIAPPFSSLYRTLEIYHPNVPASYTYKSDNREIGEAADFTEPSPSDALKQQLSADAEDAENKRAELEMAIEEASQEEAMRQEALAKQLEETEKYIASIEEMLDYKESDYAIPEAEYYN